MNVFLYAPEQFENLCVTARTLEVLGFGSCYVFDPHHLVRERYGKSYTQRLRAVSAGAFGKIAWQRVAEPLEFLRSQSGRCVATVPPRARAVSLYEFRFRASDLLVIGAEAKGLSEELLQQCGAQVTIPQSGLTESLNVAVASGIVLSEWKRQEACALLEPH